MNHEATKGPTQAWRQQSPPVLFGLETEYGITRADPTELDVVAESIALVRACAAPGVMLRWNYAQEDPHLDARGFRVGALRQDTDEADYFAADARRTLTWSEIKSDYVLTNGARFYNDHAHPEYSTPECRTLADLVAQDAAGDRLVRNCAQALNRERPDNPLTLYKNNTDFSGHSYGCHENYLLPRAVPWEACVLGTLAFLVTRGVLCGAGKYGHEEEDQFLGPGFQVTQRADFFSELQSVDTMQRRPLINTRDEPHADPVQWRRFHVIVGDANLCPFATWLKVGSTALILRAIAAGVAPDRWPQLADPIGTFRTLSRDPSFRWELRRADGRLATALEIQIECLEVVEGTLGPLEGEWASLAAAWRELVGDLERDPLDTADRVDWAAKRHLIESFREEAGFASGAPLERSLDLAYHDLDPETGLGLGLLARGAFRPVPGVPATLALTDTELAPPPDTRARLRGLCVRRFGSRIEQANWDGVVLRDGARRLEVDLRQAFDPAGIVALAAAIEQAAHPSDLLGTAGVRAL